VHRPLAACANDRNDHITCIERKHTSLFVYISYTTLVRFIIILFIKNT